MLTYTVIKPVLLSNHMNVKQFYTYYELSSLTNIMRRQQKTLPFHISENQNNIEHNEILVKYVSLPLAAM